MSSKRSLPFLTIIVSAVEQSFFADIFEDWGWFFQPITVSSVGGTSNAATSQNQSLETCAVVHGRERLQVKFRPSIFFVSVCVGTCMVVNQDRLFERV